MADGFTLQIDDDMARKIEHAAEAAGMSREDYARFLLDQQLFNFDDYSWPEGDPRTAEIPTTAWEEARPWEEVEPELRARLTEKLSKRS